MDICEDLDFADDIALLAQRQTDMQGKTDDAAASAGQIGLEANVPKTKHMRMNSRSQEAIRLYGTAIEEVDEFPYLGSKMTSDGSGDAEIKSRLSKASRAFGMLKNIWRAGNFSL